MLAEPRRKKVKRNKDPQNMAWSNDREKFGYKMLQKMGWTEGEGLGLSNSGITKHISVSVKNDNNGLGANNSNFNNYYDWQGEFDKVLKSLNEKAYNKNTIQNVSGFSDEDCDDGCMQSKPKLYTNNKNPALIENLSTKFPCLMDKNISKFNGDKQYQLNENDCPAINNDIAKSHTIHTFTNNIDMKTYFKRKQRLKRKMENLILEETSTEIFNSKNSNFSRSDLDFVKISQNLMKDNFKKKKL